MSREVGVGGCWALVGSGCGMRWRGRRRGGRREGIVLARLGVEVVLRRLLGVVGSGGWQGSALLAGVGVCWVFDRWPLRRGEPRGRLVRSRVALLVLVVVRREVVGVFVRDLVVVGRVQGLSLVIAMLLRSVAGAESSVVQKEVGLRKG